MSFPLDLTITGRPTPRTTERVSSARKTQRPLSANRARSTQSDIFGVSTDANSRQRQAAKGRPVVQRINSAPAQKLQERNAKDEPYDKVRYRVRLHQSKI